MWDSRVQCVPSSLGGGNGAKFTAIPVSELRVDGYDLKEVYVIRSCLPASLWTHRFNPAVCTHRVHGISHKERQKFYTMTINIPCSPGTPFIAVSPDIWHLALNSGNPRGYENDNSSIVATVCQLKTIIKVRPKPRPSPRSCVQLNERPQGSNTKVFIRDSVVTGGC